MEKDKKTQRVDIRITDRQKKLIEKQAEELGMKTSKLVRLFIVKGLHEYFLSEE